METGKGRQYETTNKCVREREEGWRTQLSPGNRNRISLAHCFRNPFIAFIKRGADIDRFHYSPRPPTTFFSYIIYCRDVAAHYFSYSGEVDDLIHAMRYTQWLLIQAVLQVMVVVLFGFCLTKLGFFTNDKQKVNGIQFMIRSTADFLA